MIFDKDDVSFSILDVIDYKDGNSLSHTPARAFAALSFRFNSQSVITQGKNTVEMTSGSLSFFPANTEYERSCTVDELIAFHVNVGGYNSYEIESFTVPTGGKIATLFENALKIWKERRPGYKYAALSVLYEIMSEARLERRTELPQKLNEAERYIRKRYADYSLTVPEVAAAANMSETYLRRLFKQEYGVSPKKYINDMRIEYAKTLLNSGYYNVNEVAEATGFCDSKHFSTAFKKATGYSPSHQHYSFENESGTTYAYRGEKPKT